MKKRGISGVIVTIIMVGLVLIAISISWTVISNLMEHELEDISEGTNYVTLEIKSATINDGTMKVNVERGYGKGDLDAIKFILDDGFNDPEEITLNTTLRETKDKVFLIDTELTGDIKINIIPIIIAANGKEKELTIRDTFEMADPTLIGYWAFEGNADDSSGNGNDGIVEGATLTTGKIGQAYEFDGVNDYIELGRHELDLYFDASLSWTISGWFKVKGWQAGGIFSNRYADGEIIIISSTSNEHLTFNTRDSIGVSYPKAALEKYLKEWYNFAISRKQNEEINYYIDGESIYSHSDTRTGDFISDAGNHEYFIGKTLNSSNWNDWFYFDGTIDEVKVWNRALSEEEIENIYNWEK